MSPRQGQSLYYLIVSVLIWGSIAWFWRAYIVSDTIERVYYTRSGGVYCSNRILTPCGYRLTKCSDTMVYECVTDLKYEDKQ